MLSRTSEQKLRYVRTCLLLAWFAVIISLLWDPLTPALTERDNVDSPFHLTSIPVVVQGKPLSAEPYAMGNRILWTMVLPLLPLALMLFGHETWRRVCPLSHFSQIPRMLGWQRKVKKLDRRSGAVNRSIYLIPDQSWLRENHYYFQFGFLSLGVLGRILFYNSDRMALFFFFLIILSFAFIVGILFGGKTWCNYFCPISVIQDIYTGPGGLLNSKAHIAPTPVGQSMCRSPEPKGDRSICVACKSNCSDVDLENSYWASIESKRKLFVYYGFFGLVFAFNTYFYVYSGGWDYYISGAWTHEKSQLATLFAPGYFLFGAPIQIPKLVAAPLYFAICIFGSYYLLVFLENAYSRFVARLGIRLTSIQLRHRMFCVCAFLSINLFYIFAGRSNLLLMAPWAIKLSDALIVSVSIAWLIRSLSRDSDIYRRERVARTLRDQLSGMGFRSEVVLEGRPIERLSADEVYVLAKTLPNFTVTQKREAYRAILTEALETGDTKSADCVKMLSDLRGQLGLTDSDHEAITETLGIQDPALLDPAVARSVEIRLRHENYRNFLFDLVSQGLGVGIRPAAYLASPQAQDAAKPIRVLFSISDDDHARIAGEITRDEIRYVDRTERLLEALRQLEVARFSLVFDSRPEARLVRHALQQKQKVLVREGINLVASIGTNQVARSLAQSIHALVGKESETVVSEALDQAPDDIREAFRQVTHDPAPWSYFDVIEAAKASDDVFRALTSDRDPIVAALAISALASHDGANSQSLVAELLAREKMTSPLVQDVLAGIQGGARSDTIVVMAELIAIDVFAALELDTLADIARRSTIKVFLKRDQICKFGESPNFMFVLVRGETEAWVNRDHGRFVLGRGKPGTVFGELGVISRRPRSASIEVASSFATVVAIPRAAIDELLSRDLHAARGMLTVLSGYLLDTLSVSGVSAAAKQPAPAP